MNVGDDAPAAGLRATCSHCGTTIIVGGPSALSPLRAGPGSAGSRERAAAGGASGDLPAARESVPRPTLDDDPNLPADLGLPDDLMIARDSLPQREAPGMGEAGGASSMPSVELMDPLDINQPSARGPDPGAAAPAAGASAATIPVGIDIFIGNLPAASGSPLEPLELDLDPVLGSSPAEPAPASPGLSLTPLASSPPPPPPAAPPSLAPLKGPELSIPVASPRPPPPPVPPPPPAPAGPDSGGPLDMAAMLSSLLGDPPPPEPVKRKPPVPSPASSSSSTLPVMAAHPAPPAGPGAPSVSSDAMFSLKLDAGASPTEEPSPGMRPKPPVLPRAPAAAPTGQSREYVLPTGVPALAPPRRRSTAYVQDAPPPRSRQKIYIVGAVAAVVVLAAVGLLLLPLLKGGPAYAKALAPFASDLLRDHYPAYQRGAEAILAEAGDEPKPVMRAAAAEILLLSVLGRGAEKAKVTRAEQLLADLPETGEVVPEIRRAQALLALARGKGSQAEQLLGSEAGSPDAQLITGLRRLRERKPELALPSLRGLADSAPDRLLPRYLLGLALEESRQGPLALKAYERVLARNPQHAGALVGRARLTPGPPEQRRAAAEALAKQIAPQASPGELSEAQTLQGETTLALGRSAEAVELLSRAVAGSPQNAVGQAALAEALIADGRPGDALGRLRSAESSVLAAQPTRIALAAALIASGQIAEGTSQLEGLGPSVSDNPRVPYWLGVAAERQRPPDLENASRRYRESLAADQRFLPASLRLAALLQKQGKPDKALALIKASEKAGVAPEALELAWGQALIAAKNPAEAEAVFRKAVARSPKLAAARVGLAGALEEVGKLDEAENELARAATELKAPGLRDRLAELLLKRGKKQEALAAFEAELASGNNDQTVRVRLAKLALDLGKLERAATELEAVVAESPGTPEAYFTLGRVREAAGDIPRALKEFRSALLYETHPQLHFALGRTLAALGKEDDALVHLGAAGDLAAARLERARIRMRRNRIEDALVDAEAASRLAPQDGQARFVHGLCLDLMGRADEAASTWRAALKVAPDLVEAQYRLGRYEMDKGRPGAAVELFRQAAARHPTAMPWEADLYFQLGMAELTAGSKSAAATALRRYLEVAAPDAPARPEAERMLGKLDRR